MECKGRISGKGHKKGDYRGNKKYFHSNKLMSIKNKKGMKTGMGDVDNLNFREFQLKRK